jgi:O-acetyl-ADP-ribose deacetylase (regulator of RNase III)
MILNTIAIKKCSTMKIILAETQKDLINEWKKFFKDIPSVSVYHGSIFDNPCDAIVSPANSFGFMDGGLDLALSKYLGWHVQERLQTKIKTKHYGELLVGQAEIIETDNTNFPYLISAPTMRLPMVLTKTVNPFLAMRAILLLITKGKFENGNLISELVNSVVISGLGTGVGCVSATNCARQMRIAYGQVILNETTFPHSWYDANELYHILIEEDFFTKNE